MAQFLNQPKAKPMSGFENMGKPVPMFRREAANSMLKSIGIESADERFSCIQGMADALARDHPYEAMAAGMRYVDMTGTYMLLAVLLASPEPIPA